MWLPFLPLLLGILSRRGDTNESYANYDCPISWDRALDLLYGEFKDEFNSLDAMEKTVDPRRILEKCKRVRMSKIREMR